MALNPYDLFDIRSLLSEEERAVQDTVARFTDERVRPIIGDAFDQGRFPKELVAEIASRGRRILYHTNRLRRIWRAIRRSDGCMEGRCTA